MHKKKRDNIKIYFISIILIISRLFQPVFAQPHTMYIDSIHNVAKLDTTVSVSIRTKNFTTVLGIQGSIYWDTAFIICNGVSFGNTSIQISSSDLNLADTSKGLIAIGWLDNNLMPKSVVDGSILLTLNFKVKKIVSGGGTTIRFINTPTPMTLIDGNFKNITDTAFVPGYIGFMLTNTSSTTTVKACGSYQWNGVLYSKSGHYEFISKGSSNADSIANLELTILPSSRDTVIAYLSNGTYNWHGQNFSRIGYYHFDTLNSVGCDSIVTLKLMATLPIHFITLSASINRADVVLGWSTSSNLTIDHFKIEHGIDGNSFSTIGYVNVSGNSQNRVQYVDTNPVKGTNYY